MVAYYFGLLGFPGRALCSLPGPHVVAGAKRSETKRQEGAQQREGQKEPEAGAALGRLWAVVADGLGSASCYEGLQNYRYSASYNGCSSVDLKYTSRWCWELFGLMHCLLPSTWSFMILCKPVFP